MGEDGCRAECCESSIKTFRATAAGGGASQHGSAYAAHQKNSEPKKLQKSWQQLLLRGWLKTDGDKIIRHLF